MLAERKPSPMSHIDIGKLTNEEWKQLQSATSQLERCWSRAEAPVDIASLAELLPSEPPRLRLLVLHELVKEDLEIRWLRKVGVPLESYLTQYPNLRNDPILFAKLLREEYYIRHKYGDKPPLEDYSHRFPSYYAPLRQLLNVEDIKAPMSPVPAKAPAFGETIGSSHADSKPGARPAEVQVATPVEEFSVESEYQQMRLLGVGGFGEVWLAEAPGGIPVAMKIIKGRRNHDERRQEHESLQLIKRLSHQYLLQTQAYYPKEDRLVIIMELAQGTLADRLKQCQNDGLPGVPRKELIRYMLQAGEALDYLHEQGVQHRDVKPANILLKDKYAKVGDFGLAKVHKGRSTKAQMAGTLLYMAPEIFRNRLSPHSDQYSLAATYVELRLGHRLFPEADTEPALMYAHLEETPDLSGMTLPEQTVVLKALAKDSSDRYPSCLAFAEALEAVRRNEEDPLPAGGSGWKLKLLLTAVVGLVLGIAGAFIWYKSSDDQHPVVPQQQDAKQEDPRLPPNGEPAPDATIVTIDGRRYWDHIQLKKWGMEIPFHLVFTGPDDPDAFYLMENKVSNQLFAAGWSDPAYQEKLMVLEKRLGNVPLRLDKWNRLEVVTLQHPYDPAREMKVPKFQEILPADAKKPDLRWPVFMVSAAEAAIFAEVLGGKGGRLPRLSELETAVGYRTNNGLHQPFSLNQKEINIHNADVALETGPKPVGKAKDDRSEFHCRDLNGNGWEWTADRFSGGTWSMQSADDVNHLEVMYFGNSYASSRDEWQFKANGFMLFDHPSEMLSFRVAIDLP